MIVPSVMHTTGTLHPNFFLQRQFSELNGIFQVFAVGYFKPGVFLDSYNDIKRFRPKRNLVWHCVTSRVRQQDGRPFWIFETVMINALGRKNSNVQDDTYHAVSKNLIHIA